MARTHKFLYSYISSCKDSYIIIRKIVQYTFIPSFIHDTSTIPHIQTASIWLFFIYFPLRMSVLNPFTTQLYPFYRSTQYLTPLNNTLFITQHSTLRHSTLPFSPLNAALYTIQLYPFYHSTRHFQHSGSHSCSLLCPRGEMDVRTLSFSFAFPSFSSLIFFNFLPFFLVVFSLLFPFPLLSITYPRRENE